MTDTITKILNWHRAACPEPDNKAISVQIGCHYEEVNDSKMVDGAFLYDGNGKVIKPKGYNPPNLNPYIKGQP